MIRIRRHIAVPMLSLLAAFSNCEEPGPERTELEKLPRTTSSGKYTFGCLIDGKAHVSYLTTDAYATWIEGQLAVAGVFDKSSIAMFFDVASPSPGVFRLDPTMAPSQGAAYTVGNKSGGVCTYKTANQGSFAEITISHFDQTLRIVSGTFKMTLGSADCTGIIEITDGRFDITYTR
jgi:hypothetical protein